MIFFYFLISALVIFPTASADFTSTSFELENPINFLEGGQSSSSSFQYISTSGQLTQGINTSLTFIQRAGFLYFPDMTATPSPASPSGGGGSRPKSAIPGLEIQCEKIADFNCDTRVDLFDLSILLYYMEELREVIEPYDLSDDQKVDFIDTSILFYYWDLT